VRCNKILGAYVEQSLGDLKGCAGNIMSDVYTIEAEKMSMELLRELHPWVHRFKSHHGHGHGFHRWLYLLAPELYGRVCSFHRVCGTWEFGDLFVGAQQDFNDMCRDEHELCPCNG